MRKSLLILGAGGFGREVWEWARAAGLHSGGWLVRGFLDDNPGALDHHPDTGLPVIGSVSTYSPGPDEYLVCAIAEPRVKQRVVEQVRSAGARFVSVIHPTALVGRGVTLGEGCVLCPGVILTTDIRVGDFVTFNCCSSVGHDAVIGSWSTLNGRCDITGAVRLGEGVFVGSHATVIPQCDIGDWATLGAGSVVVRNVPPGATMFGVPARVLGHAGDLPIWKQR